MKKKLVALAALYLLNPTFALASQTLITLTGYCAGSTNGIGVERIKNCALQSAEAHVYEACKNLGGVVTSVESQLTDTDWRGNCKVVGDVRRGCTAVANGTCAR